MSGVRELRCVLCGDGHAPDALEYVCPDCGEVGTLDVLYDYPRLRAQLDRDALLAPRAEGMWRWRALLPLAAEDRVPPLPVGDTPLLPAPYLARDLGLRALWLKDEGRNPTASLKDRASAMVAARALRGGRGVVSTASTGNAAAALAGVCATLPELDAIIFVPAGAPEAKIAQLMVYGARVLLLDGSYDLAFELCFRLSQEEGWYCRNTGINPYTSEGKKTAAFEMAAQLGWRMPDAVVVSVGDGSIIGGLHKGFRELRLLGWTEREPRLIGVQAEGSSALVQAAREGTGAAAMRAQEASTIADSISAGLPRDRAKALRAVQQSNGAWVSVPDEAILAAIPRLAQASGVFAEPAAAAALAGLESAIARGQLSRDSSVALLVTGNGLKDVATAGRSVGAAQRVPPDANAIRRALQERAA